MSPFGLILAHAQTYSALVAEKTATANYLASPTVTNKNILLSSMDTVNSQAAAPGNVPGASNAQAIEQAGLAAYNNTPAPAANAYSIAQSTANQVVTTAAQTAAKTNTPAAATPAAATANTGSNFVPLTNIPGLFPSGGITNAQGLTAFFNSLYKICIGVAATLAVLQIIRAGFMYMGGDSVTETKQARALIATALGGLLLVLSPVIVFSIIDPKILDLQVGINNLTPAQAAAMTTTTTTPTPAQAAQTLSQCLLTQDTEWSGPGGNCTGKLGLNAKVISNSCCPVNGQVAGSVCCGLPKSAT